MMMRIPTRLALAAAVSALALTGSAAAQQTQQNQQNQQQSQQRQQAQQAQQQRGQMQAQQRQAQQRQAQSAPMEYRQVRGTVVDAKRVNVRGSQQPATVVLLEMQNGQRAVVDLGTERLGIRLRQGSELAVRGRPVNVGDRKVILQANAVSYEGRAYDVNRPAKQQTMSGSQQRQSRNQQGGNRQQTKLQLGPYDANNDAQFNANELTQALYSQFDRNGNGMLSVAEWDRGMDRYFGEGDINLSVSTWDRNGNDQISRGEFRRGLRSSGLLEQIDADASGGVTSAELRQFGTQSRTGGLNQQAFTSRIAGTGLYTNLDANADNRVGYGELSTGLYSAWDANNDNRLVADEFEQNSTAWFGDEEGLFQDWDDNADGFLSDDEFGTGVETAGVFDSFDEDDSGWFSDDELYGATYSAWDDNDDGLVGDSEWNDGIGIWEDEGIL